MHTTLEQVAGLLSLETGWVRLLQERDDESYLAAAQNLPPGLINNPGLMEGTCYCLDTYHGDDMEGAANVNVVTCSRLQLLADGTDGLRYHASIPLYGRTREKLGALNVATSDWRELSADDFLLLGTIGDLLSIAIERARLFERSAQVGALNEPNRLAQEIHDTIAQALAAITLLGDSRGPYGGRPRLGRRTEIFELCAQPGQNQPGRSQEIGFRPEGSPAGRAFAIRGVGPFDW